MEMCTLPRVYPELEVGSAGTPRGRHVCSRGLVCDFQGHFLSVTLLNEMLLDAEPLPSSPRTRASPRPARRRDNSKPGDGDRRPVQAPQHPRHLTAVPDGNRPHNSS